MDVRRVFTLIGISAVLAMTAAPAVAAPGDSQYTGGAASPPTNITPPPSMTTPGASDAGALTQPVTGNDALGNSAAAVDDQSLHVIGGGSIAAANVAPAPSRRARAQLPFTGIGLGGVTLAGLVFLAGGCILTRSGRRRAMRALA